MKHLDLYSSYNCQVVRTSTEHVCSLKLTPHKYSVIFFNMKALYFHLSCISRSRANSCNVCREI